MTFYSFIDKHLLLPTADYLTGRDIASEWRFMQRAERLTTEQLKELQSKRLKTLIEHCYNNVPYYRNMFISLGLTPNDINSRDDLQKLPILTKQIVREHYEELKADNIAVYKVVTSSTGGSTGQPMKFIRNIESWNMQWASNFRAWEWYDFHLGEKILTLGGNSLVKKTKSPTRKDIFDRVIMRNLKRSSADVDDEAMLQHYEALMRYQPHALRGYASSLVIFARYIEKNKLPICPIKVILTTGEMLMPDYRLTLQRVFNCKVYDGYGAGDGGIGAMECELQDGLHISEERCVIEITDKEGNVLPDGQTGYVCTTDLGNFAFPFIRYHVGDMAYIKGEKCQCGRNSRVLGQVMGRAGRLMYSKQGVPISPTMLPIMLYRNNDYHNPTNAEIYNKIDKFQIRQDANGDIQILLKLRNLQESHEQFDYIIENYRNHFVGSEVELVFVDDIPLLPSGKEDYCISEYKIEKSK
ncbi:MAG: phenylacetate--CoA ligase family protein [Paludibacteraceae bacterium]|nr:phenylacetate--CoA ligase family protein [Paludibacteraceae bacterium]